MKIEDLRIGNWVKYKNKFFRIYQLSSDIYNKGTPSIGLVSASGKVLFLLQDEASKISLTEIPTKEIFSECFEVFKKSNMESIEISQVKGVLFFIEKADFRLKERWMNYLIAIL